MLTSLSRRLVLSHILPLLIIVPLTGLALIYALETQILLPSLSRELLSQAALVAELARDDPSVWSSPQATSIFLHRIDPQVEATVRLADRDGRLLGSTDAADAHDVGRPLPMGEVSKLLNGQGVTWTEYSQPQRTELVLAALPVTVDGRILGVVQLVTRVDIDRPFEVMRSLVVGVLAVSLLLGTLVAVVLAINLGRPVQEVTAAIAELTEQRGALALMEHGPSEMRDLARSFNALAARLHATEDAQRRLLANLVHELGRPLGSLRSAIQALLNGAADDVALRVELLTGMEEVVRRMERLLADLTRLHDRIEGQVQIETQLVALGEWLPRYLSVWGAAARAKGLRWEAVTPPDLPIIAVDPDRFGQALGNLISNAIKYTLAGGTIRVTAGVVDHALCIAIEDTGRGIAPEEQDRIFTPLYRARHERFAQGLGLGLPIARDLVEAHGGRLEVQSTPGVGSRFSLWLPLAPS